MGPFPGLHGISFWPLGVTQQGCWSPNMGTEGMTNLGSKSRLAIKVSVSHCDMIHEYAFNKSTLALMMKSSACSDEGSGIYRRLSELRGKGVTTDCDSRTRYITWEVGI